MQCQLYACIVVFMGLFRYFGSNLENLYGSFCDYLYQVHPILGKYIFDLKRLLTEEECHDG